MLFFTLCFEHSVVMIVLLVAPSVLSVYISDPQTSTADISVCSPVNNQCPPNKECVEDKTFFARFRCCKKSVCAKVEGIYCPELGNIENATRIPAIRKKKHPFKPKERVIYTCAKEFTPSHLITFCNDDGSWTIPSPQCKNPSSGERVLQPLTTPKPPKTETRTNENIIVAFAAVVGVLLCLLLGGVGWCAWRKRKHQRQFLSVPSQSVVLENSYKPFFSQTADLMSDAISAENFKSYTALGHHNNDQKFIEEFEEIQNLDRSRPPSQASCLPENKDKNRYINIVAYDHSRVKLHRNKTKHQANSQGLSDYINANYVSSFERERAYIACQGPLPSTFNDFWRMIWENNVTVIVMITNLVEKGRRKCDQYWPQEGKEQYKHVTVVLKDTQTFANYIIRSFGVKNNKLGRRNANQRKVLQFHFTQWPDHGTPEYLLPVLTFIRRSSCANANVSPILVHCSAGVGRTGTYIVIHSMMQMLNKTNKVNVKKFLCHIRLQRNQLVQTEDQYVFVHDALLEYIESGITECLAKDLPQYFKSILASDTMQIESKTGTFATTGDFGATAFKSCLEKQFMKVVDLHLDKLHYEFARRTVNETKNRPGAILPVFRSRVMLCNRTSTEGSEYINASFVQGYRSSHEFIVSQLPLENTRKDFWQLIWDHNVPTIITILDDEWNSSKEIYWPTEKHSMHCSSFNVSFESETLCSVLSNDSCSITTRDFILEATKDDYILEVKQFEISNWDIEHPTETQCEALKLIHSHTTAKEGTTVIQDRFGATSAIQLACWHLIHSQLLNECVVDVYQAAMLACQMRPRVFTSPAHVKFLCEAALLETKVQVDPTIQTKKQKKKNVKKNDANKHPSAAGSFESNLDEQGLLDDEDSTSPMQSDKTEISVVDDIGEDEFPV